MPYYNINYKNNTNENDGAKKKHIFCSKKSETKYTFNFISAVLSGNGNGNVKI